MKPSVWKYDNDTYRGRVIIYDGHFIEQVHCDKVRKNRLKALEDARKLMKKISPPS